MFYGVATSFSIDRGTAYAGALKRCREGKRLSHDDGRLIIGATSTSTPQHRHLRPVQQMSCYSRWRGTVLCVPSSWSYCSHQMIWNLPLSADSHASSRPVLQRDSTRPTTASTSTNSTSHRMSLHGILNIAHQPAFLATLCSASVANLMHLLHTYAQSA